MVRLPVCKCDDIAESDAREFRVAHPDGELALCVVHYGGKFYAYSNRCPHTGASLNWLPDRFLDASGNYLQCSTHYALFKIENGHCVHGPCAGQSLLRWPLQQKEDWLFIELK